MVAFSQCVIQVVCVGIALVVNLQVFLSSFCRVDERGVEVCVTISYHQEKYAVFF